MLALCKSPVFLSSPYFKTSNELLFRFLEFLLLLEHKKIFRNEVKVLDKYLRVKSRHMCCLVFVDRQPGCCHNLHLHTRVQLLSHTVYEIQEPPENTNGNHELMVYLNIQTFDIFTVLEKVQAKLSTPRYTSGRPKNTNIDIFTVFEDKWKWSMHNYRHLDSFHDMCRWPTAQISSWLKITRHMYYHS